MNQPCLKTELSLFDAPLTQVTMDRSLWVDVYPAASLEGGGPIEFTFMGTQDEYLDLNDTLLYVRMNVKNVDGSDLAAASVATPTNLTLATLFSDITLSMNDTVIEGGNYLYSFKAAMSSLLQFDSSMKGTQLGAAGYHKTEATRKGWIAGSKSHEFLGPLHLDFFQQAKYLLPGVNIRIKLNRSKVDFSIMNAGAKGALKIHMEKVCLYVRKVKVNSSVLSAHEDGLEKVGNAIYPIQQSDMLSYTIPTGSSYHMQDNLFRGQTPKLIIVGFVGNAAFNGDAKDDPTVFKHFGVNYLSLQRDGESVPYAQPLQPDFANGLVGHSYMAMIQSLEMYNANVSNGISMSEFIEGMSLFVFNLTPDLSAGGGCGQPYQTGNLRLELKFAAALVEGINVIIMAIRDGRVEITKQRQVLKS